MSPGVVFDPFLYDLQIVLLSHIDSRTFLAYFGLVLKDEIIS